MWQGMNQRRFPRASYRCTVRLGSAGKSPRVSALTENIGPGGLCILLAQGMDIFAPVQVELELEDGLAPLRAEGTVVWVVRRRELKKGPAFDTGIEFSGLSQEDRERLEAVIQKGGRA